MTIERIGDRLMVVIPDDVAARLGLSEGDRVTIERMVERKRLSEVELTELHNEMSRLARPLPVDYRFDRNEVNARS